MPKALPFPVFDADNHMYENTDALTKFLPPEFEGLVKYVEINNRTKVAFKDKISDFIPNPTFARVAPPGGSEADPQHLLREHLAGRLHRGDLQFLLGSEMGEEAALRHAEPLRQRAYAQSFEADLAGERHGFVQDQGPGPLAFAHRHILERTFVMCKRIV